MGEKNEIPVYHVDENSIKFFSVNHSNMGLAYSEPEQTHQEYYQKQVGTSHCSLTSRQALFPCKDLLISFHRSALIFFWGTYTSPLNLKAFDVDLESPSVTEVSFFYEPALYIYIKHFACFLPLLWLVALHLPICTFQWCGRMSHWRLSPQPATERRRCRSTFK